MPTEDRTAQDWTAQWVAALDDLELSVDETEALLAGRPLPAEALRDWEPPRIPAPLPAHLLERAQHLLTRQQAAIAATASALGGTRQSLRLLDKVADVAGAREPAHAVYLDVRA